MGLLIVDAETLVSAYAPGKPDLFEVIVSVTDAQGKPRDGLATGDLTLSWLDGGSIGALANFSGSPTENSQAGYYIFTVERPGVYENATSVYGLAVVSGTDRGQTLFSVTIEGRPTG
jgi:hypothetical protein